MFAPFPLYQPSQMAYQAPQNARKMIENFSYGLNDQIGKGFSSKVFSGRDEKTHEPVAIKVIDLQMLKSPIHHQLLQSEIDALQTVSHQNIMKLYKVFQTQNNTYLITEFCDGGDLTSKIEKLGKIPEQEVQMIMYGIVQGYKEMKKKGIVHRDIKPANILMTKQGIPKIADFGFATTPKSPPMLPNVNVGSPLYMSPQALKHNKYSDKSDIWALGVSAYEMLHSKVPWQANTEKELAQRMITVPVTFGIIQLSGECIDFIKKCLTVEETKRIGVSDMEQHPWLLKVAKFLQPSPQVLQPKTLQQTPGTHLQNKQIQKYMNQSKREEGFNQVIHSSPLSEAIINKNHQMSQNNLKQIKQEFQGKENNIVAKKEYQDVSMSVNFNAKNNNLIDQIISNSAMKPEQRQKSNSKYNNRFSIPEEDVENVTQSDRNNNLKTYYQNHNSSMQVEPSITNDEIKLNDLIVLSQINFCRYLNRVVSILERVRFQGSFYIDEKLKFFVQKNIMMKVHKLKELIKSSQAVNSLSLQKFQEYITSPSFVKISSVIETYANRFTNSFNKTWNNLQSQKQQLLLDKKFDAIFDENFSEYESFYIILQSVQRQTIRDLIQYLDELLKVKEKDPEQQIPLIDEDAVVLLDYLVTYFQLSQLILDQFNNYDYFSSQSKIEQIAEGRPVRLTFGHYIEIRNKIDQLDI